jgi:hypothetical protein
MMDDKTIKAISNAIDANEAYLHAKMKALIDEHDMQVALNVMVNLSTSLLAKALLLAKDEISRAEIAYIAAMQVEHKLEEGEVILETATTIHKAMGKGQTCQPRPPKNY